MQQKSADLTTSRRFPLEVHNIPDILKDVDRWVMWRAGTAKPNGKFDKVPVNKQGRKVNGLAADNWLTFKDAHDGYCAEKCDGIGYVLDGSPVICGDEQLFPIALDFDNCEAAAEEYRKLWLKLGKPYVEVSPSGKGLRMFALSREPLKGGNDGEGHEMYCDRRFVTVTGNNGKGKICEATSHLQALHDVWFPKKTIQPKQHASDLSLGRKLAHPDTPESVEAIARVQDMLGHIPASCDREKWRSLVWAVMSTGWTCAVDIARNWSMTAPEKYEETAFNTLVRDYDPKEGITFGTLHHHAKLAGWKSTISSAVINETPTNPPELPVEEKRFNLLTAGEVKAQPISGYRVRGLFPSEGLAAVYGQSGSGKSFLIADLCFAIATGRTDWFGKKVKQAPVIYVALEGSAGLRNRIYALEAHYKTPLPDNFRFVMGGLTLQNVSVIERFASVALNTLGSKTVVVIDTLNQAAPGADENSSQDMGAIIAAAKLLGESLRGLVILVHHTGKDTSRGLRGHSSLLAALDAAVEVENKAGFRSWSATKVKDDATGGPQAFQLKPYTVGTDEDGLDVTSCAIDRALLQHTQVRPVTGKNQITGADALKRHFGTGGPKLPEEKAIGLIAAALLNTPAGRRRTVAKEVLNGLVHGGHFCLDEGGISQP